MLDLPLALATIGVNSSQLIGCSYYLYIALLDVLFECNKIARFVVLTLCYDDKAQNIVMKMLRDLYQVLYV